MKREHIIIGSAFALASAMAGCGPIYSCGSNDDLEADLSRIEGTTRTFELSDGDGVLRVEATFGDVAVASRCRGGLLASLSDLLVPPAHAECAPPSANITLTHTATWMPNGGESVVLSDVAAGTAWYTENTTSFLDLQGATVLEYHGWGISIAFASCDEDARSLELANYSNPGAGLTFDDQVMCP